MGWDGARQGPPVLSLKAGEGEAARRDEFLATLRQAARDPGAFYLEGHGIDPSVIDQVEALSRRFFALPEDEKRAIDMVNSPHFHGYTRVGAELTRGAPDWREQLDIGSERPLLPQGPDTPAWARLQGPNQWPAALPDLRAAVLRLQAELTAVALALLERIALALGERADFFADLYEGGPDQLLKIIRYPGRAAGEGDQGVGPHKDSGLLTFVLQRDRGGLQIEREGHWVDVPPRPGTFAVNIGELLELATNGYLKATVHRVVSPPADSDRLSIAFFLGARLGSKVPLLDLPPDLAALATGPERDPDNPLFLDVGENRLKGRLRSHPDVARRHYADLLGPDGPS